MDENSQNILFICKEDGEFSKYSKIFDSCENLCVNLKLEKQFDHSFFLAGTEFDLFVLDFELLKEKTIDALKQITETNSQKIVLIFADEKDKHFRPHAINAGAADFLVKQKLEPVLLERAIHNSIKHNQILAELRESQSKFQDLVEHLPAMFYISEAKPPYTQIYASPSFAMLGYDIEEWLQEENIWQSVLHPDDREWVLKETDEAMEARVETDYEYRIIAKDGTVFWVHDRGHYYKLNNGRKTYWQGLMTDITERKIAQQQLIKKAMFDEMTGLPNRRNFIEKLVERIEKSNGDSSPKFAVCILDMDRFKLINDSMGHVTADKFLIETGRRLQKVIDPVGFIARLGGDEFVVLIDDADDLNEVKTIAKAMQKAVSEKFVWGGFEFASTVSIGITISNEDLTKPENLLRTADVAMYHSKSTGRNHFEFFDLEVHEENVRRLRFEDGLRYALERDELSLWYQPIVSLETGKVHKVEALLRWKSSNLGKIGPDEFIPIAEEFGLIDSIGNWVLEQACHQLKHWQMNIFGQEGLCMSVNISAKQAVRWKSIEDLKNVLEKEDVDPQHLFLEITETALMENTELCIEIIERMHNLGVKISTDDFGTGYSSLSYLHRFPFEELKIDGSFVGNLDTNPKSENIVRTIVNMAKSLDLKIVAEGIETKAQLDKLIELGCEFGQGFYFTEAVPASEIEPLLRAGFQHVIADPDDLSDCLLER